MANFFDKIGEMAKTAADKTGEMAKTAADKTGDMLEINRLNSKINSEEGNISRLKEQIGNFYWEKYSSGAQPDAEIAELIESINVSLGIIETTKEQISSLKG